MTAKGDFFPRRVNQWFLNATYAADVRIDGFGLIKIPAPIALDADGILSATSIATAVDTTAFASSYNKDVMAKFGRNVTVVASGAATSTVTVFGYDYLGQPMQETLTLNGNTPVLGVKCFRHVTRVTAGVTAATTINVGWGNRFGLPYKLLKLDAEFVSNAVPADAGTATAGTDTTVTATSAEPRGSYVPHTNNISNGARYYEIAGYWDNTNLYGVKQYNG